MWRIAGTDELDGIEGRLEAQGKDLLEIDIA
jgi:hypothetical protein